jgi:Ribonuclease G/E
MSETGRLQVAGQVHQGVDARLGEQHKGVHARLGGQQGVHARLGEISRKRPYGSAILSLLVAADQRCPAIIGQAHVLYHGRFDAKAEKAERAFRQLKRDAADLFDAIAAVEAAMSESCPQQTERP